MHQYYYMRTTIDIPEVLLRKAKARAALRGIRLKDFVAEAIRMALTEGAVNKDRDVLPRQQEHVRLGENCIFPVIRGECGPAMRDLTPERIHEILEFEDVARALHPRGC